MFKIDCVCEDRHLANVMRALAGLVRDLHAVPMVNVAPEPAANGALQEQLGGGVIHHVHAALSALDSFVAEDVRDALRAAGRSPSSYSYYLRDMLKHGLARKTGKFINAAPVYSAKVPQQKKRRGQADRQAT